MVGSATFSGNDALGLILTGLRGGAITARIGFIETRAAQIEDVLHARVPIIKFRFGSLEAVECDLSVDTGRGRGATQNTSLLKVIEKQGWCHSLFQQWQSVLIKRLRLLFLASKVLLQTEKFPNPLFDNHGVKKMS